MTQSYQIATFFSPQHLFIFRQVRYIRCGYSPSERRNFINYIIHIIHLRSSFSIRKNTIIFRMTGNILRLIYKNAVEYYQYPFFI